MLKGKGINRPKPPPPTPIHDENMKQLRIPMQIKDSVGKTGPRNGPRQEVLAMRDDAMRADAELVSKWAESRTNVTFGDSHKLRKLEKKWKNFHWYHASPSVPLPETELPLFYRDDTPGAMEPNPLPKFDWVEEPLSNLNIIDHNKPDDHDMSLMIMTEDGEMIICKPGRHRCQQIPEWRHKLYWKWLHALLLVQRSTGRGKARPSAFETYVYWGNRVELGRKVVETYVPRDCTLADDRAAFDNAINLVHNSEKLSDGHMLVADLEQTGMGPLNESSKKFKKTLASSKRVWSVLLNGETGYYSQLGVGYKYWSAVHTDDDFLPTTISCLSEKANKDDILFYFVFPTFGFAIPMRKTDVAVFNSRWHHCVSNYRVEDTISYGAFTTANTILTQMADTNAKDYGGRDDTTGKCEAEQACAQPLTEPAKKKKSRVKNVWMLAKEHGWLAKKRRELR